MCEQDSGFNWTQFTQSLPGGGESPPCAAICTTRSISADQFRACHFGHMFDKNNGNSRLNVRATASVKHSVSARAMAGNRQDDVKSATGERVRPYNNG